MIYLADSQEVKFDPLNQQNKHKYKTAIMNDFKIITSLEQTVRVFYTRRKLSDAFAFNGIDTGVEQQILQKLHNIQHYRYFHDRVSDGQTRYFTPGR